MFISSKGKGQFVQLKTPDKKVYQMNIFLISPQNDMLWVFIGSEALLMRTTICVLGRNKKNINIFVEEKKKKKKEREAYLDLQFDKTILCSPIRGSCKKFCH